VSSNSSVLDDSTVMSVLPEVPTCCKNVHTLLVTKS